MSKTFFNWSGGKDSALALFKILQDKDFSVESLLTSVNEAFNSISMHGVREELLNTQAREIGLPLDKIYMPEYSSIGVYDKILSEKLEQYRKQDIEVAVFGDIFLEDLKKYREDQLAKVGLKAHFPLWKQDTSELIKEFIDLGFKTIITCVSEKHLDKSFVGRVIDKDFINDLPKNVDPCGENGEFHSFVFDGPIFSNPLAFETGEKTYRKYENENDDELNNGFWYCDLIPN